MLQDNGTDTLALLDNIMHSDGKLPSLFASHSYDLFPNTLAVAGNTFYSSYWTTLQIAGK